MARLRHLPLLAPRHIPSDNAFVLADRPLPADLEQRIAALAGAWRDDHDLAALYLFGSRARGKAHPRSDVDLAAA
jgi:hypothetical protein